MGFRFHRSLPTSLLIFGIAVSLSCCCVSYTAMASAGIWIPTGVPPQPKSEARVFVVGLLKAGTSSLHDIFSRLASDSELSGHSCHWVFRINETDERVHVGIAIQAAYERNLPLLHNAPKCRYLAQMDYLGDPFQRVNCAHSIWPQMTLLRELDHQYPGSKFILNTRPIQDHVNSINNWGSLRKRLIYSNVPGLPPGNGETGTELAQWIANHNKAVRMYFRGRSKDFMESKLSQTTAVEICNFLSDLTKIKDCSNYGEMPRSNVRVDRDRQLNSLPRAV